MVTSSTLSEGQLFRGGTRMDRREALLTNPSFVLLWIPLHGEMRLVRPALYPKVQRRLKGNSEVTLQYHTLSHLWGIHTEEEKQQQLWDVGSFIRDENGDPVAPIPMRAEKRDTLLALLKKVRGYWWIDVLCARVSTPLGIMGSIYLCCGSCYAMVDCEPQVLKSLSNQNTIDEMFDDYERLRVEGDKDEQQAQNTTFAKKWSTQLQLMYQLTRSVWFKRVWTWQEATLPCSTKLIPESGNGACVQCCVPIQYFCHPSMKTLAEDLEMRPHITGRWHEGPHLTRGKRKLNTDPRRSTPVDTRKALRRISDPWREIHRAWYYSGFTVISGVENPDFFVDNIAALGQSTRTCMEPADYVYGALGILDMSIDRMDDYQAIWENFLTTLDKLIRSMLENYQGYRQPSPSVESISISDKAYSVDLSKARNMADVYDGLLNVTYFID